MQALLAAPPGANEYYGTAASTENPAPKKKKAKPYWYVSCASKEMLNVYLNFCDYREGHMSRFSGYKAPKITSENDACKQLLRADMDYRAIRLPYLRIKQKRLGSTFADEVRKGLRWRERSSGPFYDYFGSGPIPFVPSVTSSGAGSSSTVPSGHVTSSGAGSSSTVPSGHVTSSGAGSSSTAPSGHVTSSSAGSSSTAPPDRVFIDLEAGSNPVAAATAVQTGTAIPPKPTLPPFPVGPTKQVGNLHPIKHPFTAVEMQSFSIRNPNISIGTLLKIVYESSTSVDQGTAMYKAMGVVCALVSPTQRLLQQYNWLFRVAKDLHFQGICDGGCSGSLGCAKYVFGQGVCRGFFPKADDIHGCRRLLSIAFKNNIKVFATLDDGPAPPNEVSLDEYNKYYAAKYKFRDLQRAYDTAYALRQAWEEAHGKRAAAIVPEAPDSDDEEIQMLSDEDLAKLGLGKAARKRAGEAALVCIDCDDPAACGCAERALAPPKKVKAEPPVV